MVRRDAGEKTFVKVTNADIYREIRDLKEIEQRHHEEVTSRQNITNGKVKKSLWIATTAISLILLVITLFIEHIMRS